MGAITTLKQNNKPWTLTWKASGRYPIVADRIFATLADAQSYVDDKSATASATGGLVLSVISDPVAKNNGVYYVKSVANTDPKYGALLDKGTLVKVGGAETEVAATYSAAVTLSNTLVVGQLIKVSGEEIVDGQTYKAGFYIVNTPGSISALDTSTGASDEIGALTNRVTTLEGNRVLNTDFANYKTEVTNGLAAKADATALTTHTTDTAIHVTAEDKAKWNNAESNANAKLAEELAKLPSMYDAKGDAGKAQAAAQNYADSAVSTAVGAYAAEGVEASGLRKEIAAAEAAAKSHADSVAATAKSEAISEAGTAASGLLDAYKTEVGNTYATKGEQSALETSLTGEINKKANAADVYVKGDVDSAISTAKGEAISAANSYADGLASNYDAAGSATTAEANAKAYTDETVGTWTAGETAGTGLRKEIEEKVAAVAAEAKSYSIAAVTGDELAGLGANVKEAYKLVDEDGAKAGEVIKIYRDSALQKVELVNQELQFTYLLADGTSSMVPVSVATFLAESEFGDGLQVNAESGVVSVKVDAASESFLTVGADGIKLSGVQTAINTAAGQALADAKTYADGLKTAIDGVIEENERVTSEALTNLDKRVKTIEDQDTYVKSEVDAAIATAKSGAETTAKNYTDAAVGVYASEGAEASGLRKEIAERDAQVLVDAKAYTDSKVDGKFDAAGAAAGALETAKKYTDDEIAAAVGVYASEGVEASGLRKEIADNSAADQAYAKAYTDELFDSFQFATNSDIDTLFAPKAE